MSKKKGMPTGLYIGIGLAIITFVLIFSLVSSNEPITVKYYVAKEEIGQDVKITDVNKYFAVKEVPESVILENAIRVDKNLVQVEGETEKKEISGKDMLENKETYFPIGKGDFEIKNKISDYVPEKYKNISKTLPNDKRLVSLEMNNLSSFGATLKQGDRIDLTFVFENEVTSATGQKDSEKKSQTLLQALKINSLIYDGSVQTEDGSKVPPSGVSVLMTPEQVELFALYGKSYTLSLNSSNPVLYDTKGLTISQVSKDAFKQFIFSNESNQTNQETDANKEQTTNTNN